MNYVRPPEELDAGSGPAGAAAGAETHTCLHCGLPVSAGARFCCSGCAGAHALIHELGLDAYYRRRTIDPSQPALKPVDAAADALDLAPFISPHGARSDKGAASIELLVEGLHCAACVWLI